MISRHATFVLSFSIVFSAGILLACVDKCEREENIVETPRVHFGDASTDALVEVEIPPSDAEPDALVLNDSDAPTPDYATIGTQACRMAGGTCAAIGVCSGAMIHSVDCGPGASNTVCCRQQADCEGLENARCCYKGPTGRVGSSSGACDRGYPACYGTDWLSSSGDCTDESSKVPQPGEDLESRWEGAVSSLSATTWACHEAGGDTLPVGEACDGILLPFSKVGVTVCCAPHSVCPSLYVDSVCCPTMGSKLSPKRCINGRAVCDAVLVQGGLVKEVPRLACKAAP